MFVGQSGLGLGCSKFWAAGLVASGLVWRLVLGFREAGSFFLAASCWR